MPRIDRRVARTRALLQRAHLALVVEKGYEAVTVEDICAAADVGRSTFYAHYPNKEALHVSGLETLRRELAAHQSAAVARHGGHEGALGFSLPMFEHAGDHLALYRALAGSRGGGVAIEQIRQGLSELVRQGLPLASPGANGVAEREAQVALVVGAYMAVLTWWLDNGATIPPAEMDARFRRFAAAGLATLAETSNDLGVG